MLIILNCPVGSNSELSPLSRLIAQIELHCVIDSCKVHRIVYDQCSTKFGWSWVEALVGISICINLPKLCVICLFTRGVFAFRTFYICLRLFYYHKETKRHNWYWWIRYKNTRRNPEVFLTTLWRSQPPDCEKHRGSIKFLVLHTFPQTQQPILIHCWRQASPCSRYVSHKHIIGVHIMRGAITECLAGYWILAMLSAQ